jgi:hypothetical protein
LILSTFFPKPYFNESDLFPFLTPPFPSVCSLSPLKKQKKAKMSARSTFSKTPRYIATKDEGNKEIAAEENAIYEGV